MSDQKADTHEESKRTCTSYELRRGQATSSDRMAANIAQARIHEILKYESRDYFGWLSKQPVATRDRAIVKTSQQGNFAHIFAVLQESLDILFESIGPVASYQVRKFFDLQKKVLEGRFSVANITTTYTPTLHAEVQNVLQFLPHAQTTPAGTATATATAEGGFKARRSSKKRRSVEAQRLRRKKMKDARKKRRAADLNGA